MESPPPPEPPLVTELVSAAASCPATRQQVKWGADFEDSATPEPARFAQSSQNLLLSLMRECEQRGARGGLGGSSPTAVAIKRLPGLELPDVGMILHGNPLPLHLVDFCLHIFFVRGMRKDGEPDGQELPFYMPKLETENEAKYVHRLFATATKILKGTASDQRLASPGIQFLLPKS